MAPEEGGTSHRATLEELEDLFRLEEEPRHSGILDGAVEPLPGVNVDPRRTDPIFGAPEDNARQAGREWTGLGSQ